MDKSKYRVYVLLNDGTLHRLATPPDGWTLEGIKKLKAEVLEEKIGKILYGVRENHSKEKEIYPIRSKKVVGFYDVESKTTGDIA